MSLLMEALRKAEEAKRRMQQEEQAAAADRDSRDTADAPRAPSARSPFTLEDREPEPQPDYTVVDNFTAAQGGASYQQAEPAAAAEPEDEPAIAREPDTGARTLARRQQRAAAASVFVAKQNPARNRKLLTVLVIVMVLMIPLGGGVLWYLQSMSPSSLVNPNIANFDLASRGMLGDEPAPPPADAPVAETVADPSSATPVPEQVATAETVATPEPVAEEIAETESELATEESEAALAEAPDDTADVAVTNTPAPPLPPTATTPPTAQAPALALPESRPAVLEVSRTRGTTEVNPELVNAYNRLQAGDLLMAGQLYQEVLAALPNNRDALLGMALVYLRQGEPAAARSQYARILQLNPRDPLAQTGLLQTTQVTDPTEHEGALKALIADFPDVAQLQLALGHLHASQRRWSEAQGAYYNALLTASRSTDGPVHPDYAFNLAVSLEQLNEPRAALDYYRQAQELARVVTPSFDPQVLNSRLACLEQNRP